ncbi:MAG: hypothetical protein ABEK00_00765 [Candidatus Nanohaloarchaea archaeon]
MELMTVLRKSLEELASRPTYFVPRLVSTSISTAWFIYMTSQLDLGLYLVSAPFIIFIGIFVPVMVAYMVDKQSGLIKAFTATLRKSGKLFLSTIAFFVIGAVAAIPTVLGLAVFLLSKNLVALILGFALSVGMILVTGVFTYFLPITLNRESFVESFRKSASFSNRRRSEVTALILFSFVLLGLSTLANGLAQKLGLIAFAVGRFTSAVISTYLIIVSPKYYLEEEEE